MHNQKTLETFINTLKSEFEVTVTNLNVYLGMQIVRDENSMFVNQKDYIKNILRRFKMEDANPIKTPADPNIHLVTPTEIKSDFPYREAVGSLLFLTMVSRPDLPYAVGVVSRYLDKHDESHWRAVKRILRYVKQTQDFGLLFTRDYSELIGFSDADYAADLDTRRSTTGYVFMMSGGCVTWCSRRQATVSVSTTEAEFIAASEASKEAIWLRKLLSDIGHECVRSTTLYVDNQSAIKLVKNPSFHRRSKHIDVRYQYICEKQRSGEIETKYVKTNDQYADFLTKPLCYEKYNFFRAKMNVISGIAKTPK